MSAIRLSKRLSSIASFLSSGTYFADIGSDHAYLPCYICLKDEQARAIAGDINYGPYLTAKTTVEKHNLQDVIDVRHGAGLSVLCDENITELVIAGMGGSIIKTILDGGEEKIQSVKRVVVQPNTDVINVRKWMMLNGFKIEHEVILEENDQIYEIIVADRNRDSPVLLSDKELYFGPQLLRKQSEIFTKKWQAEKEKLESIIKQLLRGKTIDYVKINCFQKELSWIKEVLQYGKDK